MPYEHVPEAIASGESNTPSLAVAPARLTSLSRHAVSTGCHTCPLPPLVASLYLCGRYHTLGFVSTSQGFWNRALAALALLFPPKSSLSKGGMARQSCRG